jgi:RNA polymerase sigma-70 factor, ECF subfamily
VWEQGESSIIPNDPSLRRAQDFDPDAWSQIFDKHYERIYRYAYRRLGDQEAAQSITSDAFYRLLVASQDGRGPREGVLLWLYRTAHNLVIDVYRQSPKQTLPLDETLLSDKNPSPEEALVVLQEQEQVRAALWLLTPDQQQVVALKFMEGFENEEVAEMMEISVGAVKSLQHRALARLARILRAAPPRPGRRSAGAEMDTK